MRLAAFMGGNLLGAALIGRAFHVPLRTIFLGYACVWGMVFVCMLGGCTGLLQDPPANMEKNLTPDSLATAPTPPAQPPPDVSKARRVGWKPRHATPAGDVVEGHAIELTPTPLVQEGLAPPMVIPRAPRFVTPPSSGASPGTGRSRPVPETAAPPLPQPVPAPTMSTHPLLHGQGGLPYVPATP